MLQTTVMQGEANIHVVKKSERRATSKLAVGHPCTDYVALV